MILNEIHIKLKKKKKYIYIRIFQIRKRKMTKVGFENWLIWSDYTLVVSTASLIVTTKADAC